MSKFLFSRSHQHTEMLLDEFPQVLEMYDDGGTGPYGDRRTRKDRDFAKKLLSRKGTIYFCVFLGNL